MSYGTAIALFLVFVGVAFLAIGIRHRSNMITGL